MNGDALTMVTTTLQTQANNLLSQASALEADAASLQGRCKALLASAADARAAAAQLTGVITTLNPVPNQVQSQPIPGV